MSHHVRKGYDVIPTLGLRMLYGAAASMSSPGSKVPLWEDFAEDFQQYLEAINADVSAKTAAKVLREVYGRERRLLVLVDEVSKARPSGQADANVMTELGDLLESDGTVDVLVSSLSAKYVAELLSGSNRKLQYVVMTPLLHSRLGEPETQRWSEELLQQASQGRSVDAFVVKLLRSTHLLCSGYPRSLERLVWSYRWPYEWSFFSRRLKDDPKCSISKLLRALSHEVWGIAQIDDVSEELVPAALGYVLSAKTITADGGDSSLSTSSALMREMLESGSVFLVSEIRNDSSEEATRYQVSMTLAQFLRIMKEALKPDLFPPVGKVAWELFNPLLRRSSIANFGTWFERSVALTAIVRSMDQLEIAEDVEVPPLTLKIASTEAELRKALANDDHEDVLIVPGEENPGLGIMVVVGKKKNEAAGVRYYLQCKAARSTRHTHLQEVARCILNAVQKHMEVLKPPSDRRGSGAGCAETKRWTVARQREELAKIKIVFFCWVQEELKLSADEVRQELESNIAAKKKSKNIKTDNTKTHSDDSDGKKTQETEDARSTRRTIRRSAIEKMALAFVESHFRSSFYCMSGARLRQWMLPVLQPVPGLVHAILDVEEAESALSLRYMEMSSISLSVDSPKENSSKPKFTRFGHIWSREDDDLLRAAVEAHGNKPLWDSIAKSVPNRGANECKKRWKYLQDPDTQTARLEPWTDEEDAQLQQLVEELGTQWVDVAAALGGTRGAGECHARWNFINAAMLRKGRWLAEEDALILEQRNTNQLTWTEISLLLVNRHPDVIRQRYLFLSRPKVERQKNPKAWTEEEDAELKRLAEEHGAKNWELIASHFPGRSHYVCYRRYTECILRTKKSGSWSAEEDVQLTSLVKEHGPKWAYVSRFMDGRTPDRCRQRWAYHLDPSLRRGNWTAEEDAIICQRREELNMTWSDISALLPGRCSTDIKDRYRNIMKSKMRQASKESGLNMDLAMNKPKTASLGLGGNIDSDSDENEVVGLVSVQRSLNLESGNTNTLLQPKEVTLGGIVKRGRGMGKRKVELQESVETTDAGAVEVGVDLGLGGEMVDLSDMGTHIAPKKRGKKARTPAAVV